MEIEIINLKRETAPGRSVLIRVEKFASNSSEMSTASTLKRSSSAPTSLNYLGVETQCFSESCCSGNHSPATVSSSSVCTNLSPANVYRRNSAILSTSTTPESAKKVARRLHCLRKEGNLRTCIETDYAAEKLFRNAAQISNSWSDFQIEDLPQIQAVEERKRAKSVCEPVHILTNFLPASCSPSPTRNEKQCYSPSMQQVVRKAYFSPSPSPSPTRRSFLRSLSPIAVRQHIGFKRKYDSDSENTTYVPPVKRVTYTPPVPMQIDRDPSKVHHPVTNVLLNHSLSVSSLDSESSSNSTICSDFTTTSDRSCYSLSSTPAIGGMLFEPCLRRDAGECPSLEPDPEPPTLRSSNVSIMES